MSSSPRRAPGDLLVHLRRARDHMDRHYTEPLDLAAVAAVAGISKYHFQRLFTATYGLSPAAYLSRRRIEWAQDLLRAGVEAVARDNSGNWLVLVELREFSPADFD